MLNKRERHTSERKKVPSCGSAYFFFLFQKTSLRNDGFLWPKFNRLKNRTTFFSYLRFVRGFLLIVSSSHCCCCAENVIMTSMLTLQFFFVLPSNIETKQKTIAQYICWLLIMAIYNNNECTLMALMFMDAADDQSAIVDRREK